MIKDNILKIISSHIHISSSQIWAPLDAGMRRTDGSLSTYIKSKAQSRIAFSKFQMKPRKSNVLESIENYFDYSGSPRNCAPSKLQLAPAQRKKISSCSRINYQASTITSLADAKTYMVYPLIQCLLHPFQAGLFSAALSAILKIPCAVFAAK